MSNFDIVFLGGLFPAESIDRIYHNSKGVIQTAANAFQWNVIEGLDINNGIPVKIINSKYIGSFPSKYKKLVIKTYNFKHTKESNDINVGFLNVFLVKHLLRYLSLKPHLKKWALSGNDKKVIIAYAMTISFVKALRYVNKINPNACCCIIVPDLPIYMQTSSKSSLLYKLFKKYEIFTIMKNLKCVNFYIFITKYMKQYFRVDKNYTVIEGISCDNIINNQKEINDLNEKVIFYSGTLNKKYGIIDLISAFQLISFPNYKLVLCGEGDCQTEVVKASKTDDRIIYKGQIKRDEVLALQRNATVLINPRKNNEEYTKYSFPSKILEYLSSGTPIIAYKLDGIPDEYDDYLNYVDGETIEDLTRKIIEICEKTPQELSEIGLKAQNYVFNFKNKIVQTKKILDNINEYFKDNIC